MSLTAFVDYLLLERKYSVHTVSAYQKDIDVFSLFCVSEYELGDISLVSYPMIRSWVVVLVDSGVTNRTINRKVASLKAYYRFLQKIGVIEVTPLAKHRALKVTASITVPFSEVEMQNVLREIVYPEGFVGVRDRLLIEVLYATGMRRAELIGLKLSDVDIDQGSLKVLGKRNKERIIPLLLSTVDLVKLYIKERGNLEVVVDEKYFFLLKTGNKLYETLVYRVVNGYFGKVSTKVKRSPHLIRHTFATHLLNEGADLNAVKELLGHSSLASTQVYTHNNIENLKKVHAIAHPRARKK